MDSDWQDWRHLERYWEEFEEKGWEIGPVKRVHLPPVLAETGTYRLAFRQWDSASNDCLFELRELREGAQKAVVLVWGVPTPEEAADLLRRHGVAPNGAEPEEVRADPGASRNGVPEVRVGSET